MKLKKLDKIRCYCRHWQESFFYLLLSELHFLKVNDVGNKHKVQSKNTYLYRGLQGRFRINASSEQQKSFNIVPKLRTHLNSVSCCCNDEKYSTECLWQEQ